MFLNPLNEEVVHGQRSGFNLTTLYGGLWEDDRSQDDKQ